MLYKTYKTVKSLFYQIKLRGLIVFTQEAVQLTYTCKYNRP